MSDRSERGPVGRLPRAVITGVGVVSPIGIGAADFTAALRSGRSGARAIRAFDCRGFQTRIAAEVNAGADELEQYVSPRKLVKTMSRATLFAVAAAALARRDAGLGDDTCDPLRLGVAMGAGGMGPVDLDMLALQAHAVLDVARVRAHSAAFGRAASASAGAASLGPQDAPPAAADFDVPAFAQAYAARANPLHALRGLPNLAAAHVAIQHRAQGPNITVATACTAGTQALGQALAMIRLGNADVVLAGGTDAMINPTGVLGFSLLGTLSRRNDEPTRASRPFDRDRDGFVLGEGAAVLVVEREEFARARGARLLAELAGASSTCDAYRITDERPDASGAEQAMRLCLEDAEVEPSDVEYINAHGTGTRMNDTTEALAIRKVFGPRATDGVGRSGGTTGSSALPVSSTKSMVGHMLAAAGAVEAAACVAAIVHGFVPPTINHTTPDPECPLDVVPNHARRQPVGVCLSNSFGFGGQNACLLLRRI